MSDAKHTPGPWTASATDVLQGWQSDSAHRKVICRGERDAYSGVIEAEQLANARLIAAAPELLEALKAVQQERDFIVRCGDHIQGVVDAAIAKATGGAK
jgi:hypothetical protein